MISLKIKSNDGSMTAPVSPETGPATLEDCPHIYLSEKQCKALGFMAGSIPSPGTKLAATVNCVVTTASVSTDEEGLDKLEVYLDLAVTDMEIIKREGVNLYT